MDPALFFHIHKGELTGLICVHVNDLLWAGSCEFEKDVITRIYEKFQVGSAGRASFQYVGISVQHVVDGIELHQRNYVALLEQIKMSKSRGTRRMDDLGSEESEK